MWSYELVDVGRRVLPGTLVERDGRLSDERLRQVCAALDVAVACED
jgi:hypothetical protein